MYFWPTGNGVIFNIFLSSESYHTILSLVLDYRGEILVGRTQPWYGAKRDPLSQGSHVLLHLLLMNRLKNELTWIWMWMNQFRFIKETLHTRCNCAAPRLGINETNVKSWKMMQKNEKVEIVSPNVSLICNKFWVPVTGILIKQICVYIPPTILPLFSLLVRMLKYLDVAVLQCCLATFCLLSYKLVHKSSHN